MTRLTLCLILIASAGFGASALADHLMGPPKPAPEVDKLKAFFQAPHTWHCKGTSSPAGVPVHPVMGSAAIKLNPTGFWLEVDYREQKDRSNPMPFAVHEYFGYDSTAKAFTRIAVDVLGGWCISHAAANDDKKLAFTGDCTAPITGLKGPGGITFTKEDKLIKVAVTGAGPEGKELDFLKLDCKY